MKNKKRFLAILMVMVMSVMMALPVSAATPDVVPEKQQVQRAEGITPDGNLTLVDDFSGETSSGKQFVTLVTKNGNYFYLIIDFIILFFAVFYDYIIILSYHIFTLFTRGFFVFFGRNVFFQPLDTVVPKHTLLGQKNAARRSFFLS